MNRVLVTGASGFVGRHVIDRFVQAGVTVVTAGRTPCHTSSHEFEHIPFDLTHVDRVQPQTFVGIDCVVHLAARVHVMRQTDSDRDAFQRLNAESTAALARCLAQAQVKRFVYLSTIKVNGERTETRPFTSHDVPGPLDAYGLSKWEAEQELWRISKETGMEVAVVRPPLVYGPHVGANFLRLLRLARSGIPLPFGSLRNKRSLISVWNLADILLRTCEHGAAVGRTWLVSDANDLSTKRLFELVAKGLNRPSRVWRCPPSVLRLSGRLLGLAAEVSRLTDSLQVDVSETVRDLSWTPPVDVEEGLGRTAHWFERNNYAS